MLSCLIDWGPLGEIRTGLESMVYEVASRPIPLSSGCFHRLLLLIAIAPSQLSSPSISHQLVPPSHRRPNQPSQIQHLSPLLIIHIQTSALPLIIVASILQPCSRPSHRRTAPHHELPSHNDLLVSPDTSIIKCRRYYMCYQSKQLCTTFLYLSIFLYSLLTSNAK